MCEHGTTTIVSTPDWFWTARAVPENGICIDACIAGVVLAVWDQGVRTLGSCCGHGKRPPSLVLTEDVEQPALARQVMGELGDRTWELLQWQLVDVSRPR